MEKDTLIMSFESSCDETSVAIIKNGKEILSNIIATQIKSHQRFGGVVPEVASRHHVEEVTRCINMALDEAKVGYSDLDAVAVTYGPGLVGSLLIGIMAAKTVAFAHNLPLIKVNHLAGHIYSANFVTDLQYPFMSLLVSGGHTEIVLVTAPGVFHTLGDTRMMLLVKLMIKSAVFWELTIQLVKKLIKWLLRVRILSIFQEQWYKKIIWTSVSVD